MKFEEGYVIYIYIYIIYIYIIYYILYIYYVLYIVYIYYIIYILLYYIIYIYIHYILYIYIIYIYYIYILYIYYIYILYILYIYIIYILYIYIIYTCMYTTVVVKRCVLAYGVSLRHIRGKNGKNRKFGVFTTLGSLFPGKRYFVWLNLQGTNEQRREINRSLCPKHQL